jgi:hypothetical protein
MGAEAPAGMRAAAAPPAAPACGVAAAGGAGMAVSDTGAAGLRASATGGLTGAALGGSGVAGRTASLGLAASATRFARGFGWFLVGGLAGALLAAGLRGGGVVGFAGALRAWRAATPPMGGTVRFVDLVLVVLGTGFGDFVVLIVRGVAVPARRWVAEPGAPRGFFAAVLLGCGFLGAFLDAAARFVVAFTAGRFFRSAAVAWPTALKADLPPAGRFLFLLFAGADAFMKGSSPHRCAQDTAPVSGWPTGTGRGASRASPFGHPA